jgi:hypothetical protein
MSIEKTIDEMEIPRRNGYGTAHKTDLQRIAVSVTITHDVIGLELRDLPDGNPYSLIGECIEAFMTEAEAEQLICALQDALSDNRSRTQSP